MNVTPAIRHRGRRSGEPPRPGTALQPNLTIRLYLVAPDERRGKVEQEIRRPTFVHRDRPLPEMCGFLSFDKLVTTVEGVRKLGVTNALKPDFLQDFPEFFGDEPED